MSTQTQCARCGDDMAQHETEPRCRYNGWRNYETWAMKLWIHNDKATAQQADNIASRQQAYSQSREAVKEHQWWSAEQTALYTTAEALKAWWEEFMPELPGPWSDLLTNAFQKVDWHEIAQAYLDEVS